MCYYLAGDEKENLSHWRRLLLSDGVTIPSDVTNYQLFNTVLSTMGCKMVNIFQKCLEKCHCYDCECLLTKLSKLHSYILPLHCITQCDTPQEINWYVYITAIY